jgi:thymidylate synthase
MNNLDKQYQSLLQDILDNGVKKKDRTGTGTISVFGRQIRHKMSEGFPLLTTKKMAWKTMVTELLWFLRGDTNIKYLLQNDCNIWTGDAYKRYFTEIAYNKKLNNDFPLSKEGFIERIKTDDEFAKTWGELGPIYGKQWREWKTEVAIPTTLKIDDGDDIEPLYVKGTQYIDQIQNLINDLKTNPDSRRLMVSAWNVGELYAMVLPPCHNFWQMYSVKKEGKRYLSMMVNIRSNDVPLGLPFNIASYGLLLEIISRLVNMIPDELIINIGDAHIYLNQIEGIKEQLTRKSYPLPKLIFNNQIHFSDNIDEFLNSCLITDFTIENYQFHPTIKLPLSN